MMTLSLSPLLPHHLPLLHTVAAEAVGFADGTTPRLYPAHFLTPWASLYSQAAFKLKTVAKRLPLVGVLVQQQGNQPSTPVAWVVVQPHHRPNLSFELLHWQSLVGEGLEGVLLQHLLTHFTPLTTAQGQTEPPLAPAAWLQLSSEEASHHTLALKQAGLSKALSYQGYTCPQALLYLRQKAHAMTTAWQWVKPNMRHTTEAYQTMAHLYRQQLAGRFAPLLALSPQYFAQQAKHHKGKQAFALFAPISPNGTQRPPVAFVHCLLPSRQQPSAPLVLRLYHTPHLGGSVEALGLFAWLHQQGLANPSGHHNATNSQHIQRPLELWQPEHASSGLGLPIQESQGAATAKGAVWQNLGKQALWCTQPNQAVMLPSLTAESSLLQGTLLQLGQGLGVPSGPLRPA
jgi:AraC-like DNA-binding protein